MTARIVVDAMGGDNAPGEIVAGALMAVGGLGVELTLVGRTEAIRHEMQGTAEVKGLRIVEAPDVIEMDEHPTDAVKAKPNSSINVGLRWPFPRPRTISPRQHHHPDALRQAHRIGQAE